MKENRPIPFLVLTTQRSGSTWFVDSLNNLEGVRAFGELLAAQKSSGQKRIRFSKETLAYLDSSLNKYPKFREVSDARFPARVKDLFSYLDKLFAGPESTGFKLMYNQLRFFPELLVYLPRRNVKVIHLLRENYFAVEISRRVRDHTKIIHQIQGEGAIDLPKLVVDPVEFTNNLRNLDRNKKRMQAILRIFRLPTLEITYEGLVEDSGSFGKVCAFLSVDGGNCVPESKFVKVIRSDPAEVISNYAELKSHLGSTEFAKFVR